MGGLYGKVLPDVFRTNRATKPIPNTTVIVKMRLDQGFIYLYSCICSNKGSDAFEDTNGRGNFLTQFLDMYRPSKLVIYYGCQCQVSSYYAKEIACYEVDSETFPRKS